MDFGNVPLKQALEELSQSNTPYKITVYGDKVQISVDGFMNTLKKH